MNIDLLRYRVHAWPENAIDLRVKSLINFDTRHYIHRMLVILLPTGHRVNLSGYFNQETY